MLKRIGKSIKERREYIGFTQKKLAKLADITRSTMYKIERGDAGLTLKTLYKLMDVLDMKIVIRDKE